jgi:YHS domain-containing protein
MKYLRILITGLLLATLTASVSSAADQKTKPKPYTLKNCIISGDKLGEMGAPYVFVYEGREIKLCCKGCLKDFNKSPAKYVKQIEKAEAKAAKEGAAATSEKPKENK